MQSKQAKIHKIYFENRAIIICKPEDLALSDPNAIQFTPGESMDIHSLVTMVEASETLHRICIPTDDIEETYKRICAEFRFAKQFFPTSRKRKSSLIAV